MKKLFIAITLLLLIILGFGGYFMFFGKSNIWNKQPIVAPTEPVVTYETQKQEIEKENYKNIELYNNAVKDQNPALCDTITDNSKKTDCHNTFIATTAQKSGTIETCDTITETGTLLLCQDSIYNDRAIQKQERSLCEKISDPERKIFCQEGVDEILLKGYIESHTVTIEKCRELSNKFQDACMKEIVQIDEDAVYRDALEQNDVELCKKITNTELKTTCLDTIYLKTAMSSQDNDLCKQIENPDKRLYCTNQVSKTDDISHYKLAISNNDIEGCKKIATENLKNKCHDTIIIATVKTNKDVTLCDMLTSTGMINPCKQIGQ